MEEIQRFKEAVDVLWGSETANLEAWKALVAIPKVIKGIAYLHMWEAMSRSFNPTYALAREKLHTFSFPDWK